MFDQFFKEIHSEHPDQTIYVQKVEERQDSFVGGDTERPCLNIMLKDKEQLQEEQIKA